MAKYKQTVIPKIAISEKWKKASSNEIRSLVKEYYKKNLQGKLFYSLELNKY